MLMLVFHEKCRFYSTPTSIDILMYTLECILCATAMFVDMSPLVLVSAVLLAFAIAVNASHSQKSTLVVLTTADQISISMIPGLTPSHPATSCKEILQLDQHSPPGLYWIRGTDGAAKHMYCDMERSCKGVGGGWMRVVSVNMTDSSNSCPSGLRTLTEH